MTSNATPAPEPAPVPYFELRTLSYGTAEGAHEHECYVYKTKLVFEIALLAVGVVLLLV